MIKGRVAIVATKKGAVRAREGPLIERKVVQLQEARGLVSKMKKKRKIAISSE